MDVVMVPHKRIKSSDLHPANAQVLICVTEKPADVSANKRNSIELEF